MKQIFLILFLLFSIIAFSQEKELFISVMYSPEYSYRIDNTDSSALLFSTNSDSEIPAYGKRFGVDISFKIKSIIFKTGIRYSRIGYKISFLDITWGSLFGSNAESRKGFFFQAPRFQDSKDYFYIKYRYLELPFEFQKLFSNKKVSPYIEGGINPQIEIQTNQRNSRFNIAAKIGLGLQFQLSEKFEFYFQPSYRFYILNAIDAFPIQKNLYSLSTELGICYRIK